MSEIVRVKLKEIVGKGYRDFWNSRAIYRVLKGGRGSKKSVTTALWYIYHLMKYDQANLLVVRNTFNTHKDSTFALLKWATYQLKVDHLWKFKESPLEAVYLPTGQKILFRGFDDPIKLTSITVTHGKLCWVWIEEAFEIEDEQEFKTLDESIRGIMPEGLWKQITLTYNPWVESHWTKTRFWDNIDPNAETFTTTHWQNEFLADIDHQLIEDLQITDPERYKVVGLGEYGIPGGAFFNEFRRDIHVCEPFPIPKHWHRYYVNDYGLDMLAGYWIARDPEGNAYVYKEVYEPGLIVSEASRRITEVNGDDKVKVKYAPPDLNKRSQDTGKTAFDLFRENGHNFVESKNNREDGWLAVKEWLAVIEERDIGTGATHKTSRLKIFRNCTNLIRCLASIQADEKNPNDCAIDPHELTHAPDALRYWCIMWTRPAKKPDEPKTEHDKNVERVVKAKSKKTRKYV
jgi:phage terminase large subunit